ncbi:MAG: hypothetical protein IT310_09225 [Anaerolineales bacterium]|nr:hypothetical protein [Anaerolineales bacterium]
MINLLFRGYYFGMMKTLIATFFLTMLHIAVFIVNSGLQEYLRNWTYPRYIIGFGIIIALIPAGIAGFCLAFLLWRYKEEGRLTIRKSKFTGLLVGICFTMVLFFILLVSPLGAAFLRFGSWMQIIYFGIAILSGGFIGRWTGLDIFNTINGRQDGAD